MKYIGNFQNWLPKHALDTILNSQGDRRPESRIDEYKKNISQQWTDAGYTLDKIGWTLYYQEHFDQQIILPKVFENVANWWFCKLNPGDLFPLHQDIFPKEANIKRYWMACQDHQPGHVFIYNGECLNSYKAGDLFLFDHQDDWHGSCNLGFVPKISLQVVCYTNL